MTRKIVEGLFENLFKGKKSILEMKYMFQLLFIITHVHTRARARTHTHT